MILLNLSELEAGDIINIPRMGLARLSRVGINLAQDGSPSGLRYYFKDLVSGKVVASIPDSGCYEPVLWFSPFETLERLLL